MKRISFCLLSLFLFTHFADALPKFATRQGAKCQSCHLNPAGKGMRSTFGATYGREELTLPTFKEQTDFDDLSLALNDHFSIGMDFRSLAYYSESNASSSVFQMQGDLYLDLRLNKRFRIYFDKGLYSGFELFGLAKVLPLDGYIKVGNFLPAFGLRMDDHNLFIRSELGFGQGKEDTGIEVGFNPGIVTLNIGLFNGRQGGSAGSGGSKTKAVAVRADANIFTDNININVGGSFYNLPVSGGPGKTRILGGFGVVTIAQNLTVLGEFDLMESYHPIMNKQVTGNILFTEVNYILFEGIDAKIGYEFYDPNINLQDGSISRYTVGVEFFPLSGVEIRPQYRITQEKPVERANNEFHLMFHFFL